MRRYSLRIKLISSVLVIMVLSITAICAIVIVHNYQQFVEQLLQTNGILLDKIAQQTENVLNDAMRISTSLMIDENLQALLREEVTPNSPQQVKNLAAISAEMSSYAYSSRYVLMTAIRRSDGEIAVSNNAAALREAITNSWEDEYTTGDNNTIYTSNVQIIKGEGNINYHIINVVRTVYDTNEYGRVLGHVVICLNYDELCTFFKGNGTKAPQYLLLDVHKRPVYSDFTQQEETLLTRSAQLEQANGAVTLNLSNDYLLIRKIFKDGWTLIGRISKSDIVQEVAPVYRLSLLTAATGLLVTAAILITILYRCTQSIYALWHAMQRVADGNFDTSVAIRGNDEISGMSSVFNSMVENTLQLIRRIEQKEREKRDYEINFLVAQINPHFIYNTLSSVVFLAHQKENQKIVQITSSLIGLLRKTISRQGEFIELCDELELLRDYARIMQIRYGDMLNISFSVEPALLGKSLPGMLLQPLVENSFIHGLLPKGGGTTQVRITEQAGSMLLEIIDDGVGLSAAAIDHIFCSHSNKSQKSATIGLKNVDERIKLFFGSQYGLGIESDAGIYTRVFFLLPLD